MIVLPDGQHYWNTDQLRSVGVSCGEGVQVAGTCKIVNSENLTLHDGVRIDDYTVIVALSQVSIGKKSSIGAHCLLSAVDCIDIDDYVSLASGVKLYTSSDSYDGGNPHGLNADPEVVIKTKAPIRLARGVLIGANSIILGGADFHEGSALGALSLAPKAWYSVDTLYAGCPAKQVRKRSTGWSRCVE